MSFEIEGKLHKKFETESKTPTFQAREFVIVISEDNYPQYIKFQLTQDRCALIDDYEEGKPIKVHFDLRGREWNDKYFTNLNAWRLEKVDTAPEEKNAPAKGDPQLPVEPDFSDNVDMQKEDFDDLPF
jgi:hypothetical protein